MVTIKGQRLQFTFSGEQPERLDRFLAGALEGCSRTQAQRLIAEGLVLVNGSEAKASRQLQGGESIVAVVPPPRPLEAAPERIPLSVLFEDEHIIAVDKPAGMVVHPAPGHPDGTLVNALLAHCDDLSGIGGMLRPGIVHRLDVGTSGVLVVAKSDEAHLGLARQFKERTVGKIYLAVAYGRPDPREGEINAALGRDRKNRKKISTATDRPRHAITRFRTEEDLDCFSLLSLELLTGRTHQVRAHLAHIGHPIVGDNLYAGGRWRGISDPALRKVARSFPRPALHARSLRICHPVTGEEILLQAPLPPDMKQLINTLRSAV